MKMKKICAVHLTALFSVSLGVPALPAAAATFCNKPSCNESTAVSSLLLAAGMYGGIEGLSGKNGTLSLSRSATTFKSLAAAQGQLKGQDISLSYEGSSGSRLGFSAGTISTPPAEERPETGNMLFDWTNFSRQEAVLRNEQERPWYLTLNFTKEFQITDKLSWGLDSKAILFSPSTYTSYSNKKKAESQAVCMSLNLPVSYGSFLTVTPELQWSRQVMTDSGADAVAASDRPDTFYGGMSITLSY